MQNDSISIDLEKRTIEKEFLVPKKLDGFKKEVRKYLPVKYNYLVDGETFKKMLSECKNKFGDKFVILRNPNQTYIYEDVFLEIADFINKFYQIYSPSIEDQISEELNKNE